MRDITVKFLNELRTMLTDRNISIHWNNTVLTWLTNNGFTETMGARPMGRLINEQIKKPLAKILLFGDNITAVRLEVVDDKIHIRTA